MIDEAMSSLVLFGVHDYRELLHLVQVVEDSEGTDGVPVMIIVSGERESDILHVPLILSLLPSRFDHLRSPLTRQYPLRQLP